MSHRREKASWKFKERDIGKEIKFHERTGARRRPYDWSLESKPQKGGLLKNGCVGNGLIYGVTEYEQPPEP